MIAHPEVTRPVGTKTIQDWLDHEDTGGYVELIEGELIVAGGASSKHQRLVSRYEGVLNQLKADGERPNPIYFGSLRTTLPAISTPISRVCLI